MCYFIPEAGQIAPPCQAFSEIKTWFLYEMVAKTILCMYDVKRNLFLEKIGLKSRECKHLANFKYLFISNVCMVKQATV